MILNLFKISLFYAGVFVLLHAVVPHEHHEVEDEHICLHSHENPRSIFEYLEQTLHFSEHSCSDSYAVFDKLDLINQEPKVLVGVIKPFIYSEFKLFLKVDLKIYFLFRN